MRTHRAVRVVASGREGSSWPLVLETDGGRFHTKLRGAGHGTSALVAEVIAAELAEVLGLRVPPRALIVIDEAIESEDRDQELTELITFSRGLNLGFAMLEGAKERIGHDEASRIVWLDWLVLNPDRTRRNPNILMWKNAPWLIDHGATLAFHYNWPTLTEDSPRSAYDFESHVLCARATRLAEWDPVLVETLDRETIREAVERVPEDFLRALLPATAGAEEVRRRREAYVAFVWKRLKPPRPFASS
jgi:hypothetical protein